MVELASEFRLIAMDQRNAGQSWAPIPAALDGFRANLYRNYFVYTVPREFVPTCRTPMLVLAGNDDAHPFEIAEEIARLAPNAEFIPEWKTGDALVAALKRIHEFLNHYAPAGAAAR